jgi:hypothetical protein
VSEEAVVERNGKACILEVYLSENIRTIRISAIFGKAGKGMSASFGGKTY